MAINQKEAHVNIVKGASTEADVDMLCSVFPDLVPDGREITHEQVEAVLRLPRASARYRTVVARWRRRVFAERNVYIDGMLAHGRGFVALTPDEMVRFGNRKVREAGRRVKKALMVASAPADEALSVEVRRYRQRLAAAIEHIAREHRTTLRDVGRALAPPRQIRAS